MGEGYWDQYWRRKASRRRFLVGGSTLAAGAAAILAGCGDDDDDGDGGDATNGTSTGTATGTSTSTGTAASGDATRGGTLQSYKGAPDQGIDPQITVLAQANEFISALPQGYDTDVANSGGRLSAGQRQLVAFARAFLADPAVLILDEATSSLDVPSERLVQQALRTVLAGRTAVIIAHRLSTVEIADRVLVMEHGRIVEDGAPADLIAGGDGRFSELHQAWLESLA